MEAIVIFVVALGLLGLCLFLAMEQCPSCARRGTVRWLHSRVNGGPDRRYATNYRFCTNCNWSEAPAPDPSAAEARLREARQRAEAMLAAAEEARAVAEAERAAAAEAEDQLVEEEATERVIVWLLKYIAVADRRHAAGEKQLLAEQIRALFPPERHSKVELWADRMRPDSASDYDLFMTHLRGLPIERRQGIYESLLAMADADGKATKSELIRLAKARKDLGLD